MALNYAKCDMELIERLRNSGKPVIIFGASDLGAMIKMVLNKYSIMTIQLGHNE